MAVSAPITGVSARAFCIPTDAPEADGTLEWDKTTIVLVEIEAGGRKGMGYSYAAASAVEAIGSTLAPLLHGRSAFAIPEHWQTMVRAVRNIGWRGVAACAISAIDVALWDLKARILELPLASLFGQARDEVAIYGSGGLTSYSICRLRDQLGRWVAEEGCRFVKMKVGAQPQEDLDRVRAAREAIGEAELFVDANGAYARKEALQFAQWFAELGVTWFEEPVSSDDLEGLRLLRDRAPAGVEIAAGEYGYDPGYFRRMLEAGAVDVLQADATRCGGYTGFLRAAALADAWALPLSAHTAPALHLPVCCTAPRLRHIEWFHDHARIERLLFDGAPSPKDGALRPALDRPGHHLSLREQDARRFAV